MSTTPPERNLRAAISEVKLRKLYVTQGLTIEGVAAHFGLATTTISRRLRDFGIGARPRGPVSKTRSAREGIEWNTDLAYTVGLIATDGCLSGDGRHLSIVSKDIDLLQTVRRSLHLTARITPTMSGYGIRCHRLQWADRTLYRWLLDTGLMPAKSLKLGVIAVPDDWFRDFLRGCIDGDGSITTYTDRYNVFKRPTYIYTRLFVKIVSASPRFVEWLRTTVRRLHGPTGHVTIRRSPGRSDLWCLKYAKGESLSILRWMYYAPDVPCLLRKREIAEAFLPMRLPPPRRGRGRPMVV